MKSCLAMKFWVFLLILGWARSDSVNLVNYESDRQKIMLSEERMSFGGHLPLEEDEEWANRCLMAAKFQEVDEAFYDPSKFLPAKNFLEVREQVKKSKVFEFIRKMPKGGVSHAHASALAPYEYFRDEVLHLDDLYVREKNGRIEFLFSRVVNNSGGHWKLMRDVRKANKFLDSKLREHMELQACNPESVCDNPNVVWKKFQDLFTTISGLINYRKVFEKYLFYGLEQFYKDNVSFLELRTSLSSLYDSDGMTYNYMEVPKIYQKVIDKFRKKYPKFVGVKIIYTVHRKTTPEKLATHIEKFKALRKAYPDLIKGFDLVNQEDLGEPLNKFAQQLLEIKNDTHFFFHAGETNWYGHSSDENLIDAILLRAKRIGHGYALLKHPKLMDLVENFDIGIELNPISNQILRLVNDMRNHPGGYFFARNLPVIVSSDDPGFWGAPGISYDFYEAFVGMMSRKANLRALKQLAMNSITYSTLSDAEKEKVMESWNLKWREFIKEQAKNKRCPSRPS